MQICRFSLVRTSADLQVQKICVDLRMGSGVRMSGSLGGFAGGGLMDCIQGCCPGAFTVHIYMPLPYFVHCLSLHTCPLLPGPKLYNLCFLWLSAIPRLAALELGLQVTSWGVENNIPLQMTRPEFR